MKELTIISGKGGTGKTSLVASLAALAQNTIMVDADVDAADLHLILTPDVREQTEFRAGHEARIIEADCTGCGDCAERCQYEAVSVRGDGKYRIDGIACEGCGVCVHFCPEKAIAFDEKRCGEWYVSDTRFGPMVHARLDIAEENSGLLVSVLRKKAREMAEAENLDWIITDGPPGVGCPVISSVTGTDAVLIITEPTLSGLHDMERVKELADFLKSPSMLCINKYDLNPDISRKLEEFAEKHQMIFAGKIPYDRNFTSAMVAKKNRIEYDDGESAQAIRQVWERVSAALKNGGRS